MAAGEPVAEAVAIGGEVDGFPAAQSGRFGGAIDHVSPTPSGYLDRLERVPLRSRP